ncbi:unnamed protein product [Rhodiola kirilowii]
MLSLSSFHLSTKPATTHTLCRSYCTSSSVKEPDMASVNADSNKGYAKRVAVVGAGVSGLAAAYKLKSRGLNVTVFEADARAGGKLRSVSQDGLIWDEGANTMTESDMDVSNLLDNLGLREVQQFPISQNKRYIARNGVPMMLPMNPIALLKSNILSAQSKLQLILEPFLWKKSNSVKASNNQTHESVRDFFQRHFGNEVVDYLIDPFVAGTSAGDPDSLSMRCSFPELWDLEQRFGSIIAGAFQSKLASKKSKTAETETSSGKKPQRASFSFQGGMQRLTDRICQEFSRDELKLQSKVLSLAYDHDDKSAMEKWSLTYSVYDQQPEPALFDAVIMTAPLCNFKDMNITKRGLRFPLHFFPEVNYLPLSVIISTFKKENVKRPLEGFGVLVPSKEMKNGLQTLGTLFSSMMFPDRAPGDVHLYTTFVGGSRNPELAKASTDELKEVVGSDLRQLLGAEGEPTIIKHYFWSKAFPLYGKDYGLVLEAIEKLEADLPGLFYAGNHKGGLSVGKAITSGCKAADLAISYLNSISVENHLKLGEIGHQDH